MSRSRSCARAPTFPSGCWSAANVPNPPLITVVADCYLAGVSTRQMDKLVKTLGIDSLSKSQVSRMSADLDQLVEEFRHRPLDAAGPFTFVAADALTMKVREGGRVINAVAGWKPGGLGFGLRWRGFHGVDQRQIARLGPGGRGFESCLRVEGYASWSSSAAEHPALYREGASSSLASRSDRVKQGATVPDEPRSPRRPGYALGRLRRALPAGGGRRPIRPSARGPTRKARAWSDGARRDRHRPLTVGLADAAWPTPRPG